MLLKTYARLFTNDMDKSLSLMRTLTGTEPDYRFTMEEQQWEIAGIGDFLLVAGTAEALAPIRSSHGPLVVDDLDRYVQLLQNQGAAITKPPARSQTGRYFYARQPDGSDVEYVEWSQDLRTRILGTASKPTAKAQQHSFGRST